MTLTVEKRKSDFLKEANLSQIFGIQNDDNNNNNNNNNKDDDKDDNDDDINNKDIDNDYDSDINSDRCISLRSFKFKLPSAGYVNIAY